MLVSTKAIVISSIKYGDSDLIVKCYTEKGVKSYLLRRILKSKRGKLKVAYFQPLTQLELIANHKERSGLDFIKEAKISYAYHNLNTSIKKQTIAIFIAEILAKTVREEEENVRLFEFIETSLIWLDSHNEVANFHLVFLLQLSKHLGFYPSLEDKELAYFSLEEGNFCEYQPRGPFISRQKLMLFKALLGINFDTITTLKVNGKERQELLEIILAYFELHLPMFQKPRSLTVLKSVFD